MRIWHAATREKAEAERWRQAFLSALGADRRAVVAPATDALVVGDAALKIRVDDSAWGSISDAEAECRWRSEPERVALSVISKRALDGLDLEESDVDEVAREPVVLADPVAAAAGSNRAECTQYLLTTGAWLERTEWPS